MEYVYSALMLHAAGKDLSEANLKKVLEAAGVKVDESRVKALTAALEGVDIEEAIATAAVAAAPAGAPATGGAPGPAAGKKEEPEEEEEKVSEEDAMAGLGALFG